MLPLRYDVINLVKLGVELLNYCKGFSGGFYCDLMALNWSLLTRFEAFQTSYYFRIKLLSENAILTN